MWERDPFVVPVPFNEPAWLHGRGKGTKIRLGFILTDGWCVRLISGLIFPGRLSIPIILQQTPMHLLPNEKVRPVPHERARGKGGGGGVGGHGRL